MTELELRMNQKIKIMDFNTSEWAGFQACPDLALKAGMALGYKMAIEDIQRGLMKP